ncbi:MAG: SipW-dependent-type signal peptide-containing protein [Clostridia bacterium]|nr:SipW-dependent-type signal peptide-containing protein [Clostridia bacterium]
MKLKSKKSALLLSFTSLLLCFAMLAGSTFAWFTDTATTGVNKITSGNLHVEIQNEAGTKIEKLEWVTKEGTAIDNQDDILWEPGCTYLLTPFKIVNTGNLALKYKIVITGLDGDSPLLDVIKFTYKVGGVESLLNEEGHLTAKGTAGASTDMITVSAHMDEAADNRYQDKELTNIRFTVYATQDTVEYDSYDNQYDKDAPYETVKVSDEKELRTALFNAPTDGSGVKIVLQGDITLEMLYAAPNLPSSDVIQDYEVGDTLNRYKKGVHPTAEDPNHWNPLVMNQTDEEKAAYGAYYHMNANDERIARLVVKANQDVVLDLNGHNLSKADRATHGDWSDVCTSLIGNYGTLSIIDSEGTGLITGSGMISCSGGVIHNYGGALTIKGVNIDGGADHTESHSGQYVIVNGDQSEPTLYKNGTIVLDGAHIYDGATSASLICNNAGTMTIKNETELKHKNTKVINCKGGEIFVEGAKIWSDVYAIYAKGGTVTVTDSAVKINGTGTMTAEGGTIIHK